MHQTHPARQTLEAFSWRQLPPAEMLELSDHLVACADCRTLVATLGSHARPASVQHFLGDDAGLHLSEEELAEAAHDTTALSTEAQAHLRSCPHCQSEADDAASFSPRLSLVPSAGKPSRAKLFSWPTGAFAAAAALALAVFIGHTLLKPAPSSPQLIAELRDNGIGLALTSDGRLTGPSTLDPADAALMSAALASRRLPLSPRATGHGPENLRGATDATETFRLLNPADEVTLHSPTLIWQSLPSATAYRVFVYDHAFNLAAQSSTLTALSWTIDKPLTPGETYTWVVKASTPTGLVQSPRPPAPEVHFTVATASAADKIAAARRRSSSHLLLASLYASEGMVTLARHELEALQKENPSSPILQDLAHSLP